jgi:hypothetical protein
MVASVTDSPSVGTRISVMVFSLNHLCGHRPPRALFAPERTIRDAVTIVIKTDGAAYRMPRFRGA